MVFTFLIVLDFNLYYSQIIYYDDQLPAKY
ncbi:hypothetical protein EV194_10215 [Natronoflexus pectinivorans]|uniref:Uncharacterized protein n=1 Tax=Natronoflexus pectinivorans TaxID=682526 RepID=A0A4R2GKY5_9BACT|nr:hypothetical protein EV194_10215 [Natronoflexus pectinivorans]